LNDEHGDQTINKDCREDSYDDDDDDDEDQPTTQPPNGSGISKYLN
jgi:hypothetical protein